MLRKELFDALRGTEEKWLQLIVKSPVECDEDYISSYIVDYPGRKGCERPQIHFADSPYQISKITKQFGFGATRKSVRDHFALAMGNMERNEEIFLSMMDEIRIKESQIEEALSMELFGSDYLPSDPEARDPIEGFYSKWTILVMTNRLAALINRLSGRCLVASAWDQLSLLPLIIKYDFLQGLGLFQSAEFERLVRFLEAGCFYLLCDTGHAVVLRSPAYIRIDDRLQLHCEKGPAIKWRDGSTMYFLNNVNVPREVVMKTGRKLDPLLILQTGNAEVRREIVKKIGIRRALDALGGKTIDSYQDYELLNLKVPDMRISPKYLKMRNPSTGAIHLEGVPPDIMSCKEALSWRVGGLDWNPAQLT